MRIRLPKPLAAGRHGRPRLRLEAPGPARRRASRWPGRRGLLHQLLVSADGGVRRRQRLADRPVPWQRRVLHGVRQLRREPDVPAGWLVTATGTLQNPRRGADRSRPARGSTRPGTRPAIVHVVTDGRPRGGDVHDRRQGRQAHLALPGRERARRGLGGLVAATCGTPPTRPWATRTATAGRTPALVQAFWRPEQRVKPLGRERPLRPALDRVLLASISGPIPIRT